MINWKKNAFFIILAVMVLIFISISKGHSQVPQTINHQGYLTDTDGNPVNGSVSILFSIYNVESGGTALWFQAQTVPVNQGIYSVVLGGGAIPKPIDIAFDEQYWLGVKVGADNEMTPRAKLTSVPYALSADVAAYAVTANQMLCNKYEFVGFSTATSQGDGGVLNFNQMCQANFPNSRICDSKEIIETVNVPSVTGQGWVQPIILDYDRTSVVKADNRVYHWITMMEATTGIRSTGTNPNLSCTAWSGPGISGLSITTDGKFGMSSCSSAISVACCAPAL